MTISTRFCRTTIWGSIVSLSFAWFFFSAFAASPLPLRVISEPDGIIIELTDRSGGSFALETSTNLKDWTQIQTGSPTNDFLAFLVPTAPGPGSHYYRTRTTPGGRSLINVHVQMDGGQKVSAYIPEVGGALALTGTNGVKYTLTIEPGALLSGETISMTVVTNLTDSPVASGVIGGVQFEPEGLVFFRPSLLHVEFPPSVDLESVESYGWRQQGNDLSLQWSDRETNAIDLAIFHFSGAAFMSTTAAELAKFTLGGPSEDSRYSQIEASTEVTRREGGETDYRAQFVSLLKNAYEEFVKPALQAALNNCEAANGAMIHFTQWSRSVQLLGLETDFATELQESDALFCPILAACAKDAEVRCILDNDFSAALDMLKVEREIELLGCPPDPDLVTKIKNCLRFELSFDSKITFSYLGHITETHVGAEKIVLEIQQENGAFTFPSGSGQLDYLQFDQVPAASDKCSYPTLSMVGSTANVARLDLDLNIKADAQTNIRLAFDPGEPDESYKLVCPQPPPDPDTVISFPHNLIWRGFYGALHAEGANSVITNWELSSGQPFARKIFDDSSIDGVITEHTVFELTHAPLAE